VAWHNANPFDPRTGEWTALRIIQETLSVQSATDNGTALHWSTFMVPESWTQFDGALLRWDQWHTAMGESGVISRPTLKNDEIQDILHHTGSDIAFARVQEAGLLLLGLLRRSFSWPAAWRTPGMLADAGWVTKATIHEAQASSWTTGILEACLLPRQRENLLLGTLLFDHFHQDDDTISDPPTIPSIGVMSRYIERAIKVLEGGQITVRDHLPRQLVPLRVEQISRSEWGVENGPGLPADEDDE
jgi:hypothetical protein